MMSQDVQSIEEKKNKRDKEIIKASIINIIVNIILSVFKGLVGFIANSTAIIADAVNSLSDALGAIITIIGIKLSGKEPNKKHPLGYGRYEYLSDGIVAFLVVYGGVTVLIDSIKKIIRPEETSYSYITFIVLIISVLSKLVLGLHEKSTGKKYNSKALQSSAIDSISDAVVTFSVIVFALVDIIFKVSTQSYIGIIISLIILKSGFEMLRDTVDEILGKRIKGEVIENIKATLCEDENVFGAFDLILHSYGPDKYIGSIHIEVPSNLTINELDILERKLTREVYKKYGVYLSAIGIYAVDVDNKDVIDFRNEITNIVYKHKNVLQIHGFACDLEKKTVRFDIIMDYELDNNNEVVDEIKEDIHKKFSEFKIYIQKDLNVDL